MCGEKAPQRVVRERLARVESRHAAEARELVSYISMVDTSPLNLYRNIMRVLLVGWRWI